MNRFVAKFGNTFTSIKKGKVSCNFCSETLTVQSRQCLEKHLRTKKHTEYVSGTSTRVFLDDLCEAFVSANIPDYKVLKQISMNSFADEAISEKYSNFVSTYSFAPVTSCDVERSFSRFKDILTPLRNNFTEDNLEKYAVIQSFNN